MWDLQTIIRLNSGDAISVGVEHSFPATTTAINKEIDALHSAGDHQSVLNLYKEIGKLSYSLQTTLDRSPIVHSENALREQERA